MQVAVKNFASVARPVSVARALRESGLQACDANLLLQAALGVDRAYLVAHHDQILSPRETTLFEELVQRRVTGEPTAYILGEREFYGLIFKIAPVVLIPRPETELLIELALERMPQEQSCKVLELGTGSGNIAVILARHRPLACITATDCSEGALAVARQNAETLLGAENRCIVFKKSDWFDALDGETYDLIISNPPYVASGDAHLRQGDVPFEPRQALSGGADGLDCIRRIIRGASSRLRAGSWLLFEHGYDQAHACLELLAQSGFTRLSCSKDLAGIPRVSGGQIDGGVS
ncbi:MAG TPA: peptide chain release factor N(5)-glutamine methyltransferase [Burkholderiales bacterium]|nr:peptide chain release factor N(5)-glutamine methyltransferase [Burkholderiales bacterium]